LKENRKEIFSGQRVKRKNNYKGEEGSEEDDDDDDI